MTLGFLAAICATGHALARRGALTDRGAALRALVVGVAFFMGLWLVAAVVTPWAAVAAVARVIAFAAHVGGGYRWTWCDDHFTRRNPHGPRRRDLTGCGDQAPYERAAVTVAPDAALADANARERRRRRPPPDIRHLPRAQ